MSSHGLVEMISEFSMRSLISSRANPTSKKTKTRPVARCSAFHATAEGPLPQGKIASARSRRPLHLLNSPRGKDKSVTKIGKTVYPTREEAEADVKRLCK